MCVCGDELPLMMAITCTYRAVDMCTRAYRHASQVRVENGTVCAIAGSDAFLINTMDHAEWTGSFTVLGRVERDDATSWAAIREIIDQPWYVVVLRPQDADNCIACTAPFTHTSAA